MAHSANVSPEVRWYVTHPTQSCRFPTLGSDWSMRFDICDSSWYLQLTCRHRCRMYQDFHSGTAAGIPPFLVPERYMVDVHLQSEVSGLVLPALSQTTRVSSGLNNGTIWQRSPEELLRASPEFQPKIYELSQTDFKQLLNGLRFIIVIKFEDPAKMPCNVPCYQSLSEDLSRLLEQGSSTDVEFQCAGQSTKAHAVIVSARSPVIQSMLAEGKTKVVKIPDMEPDVFNKFLRYLYTGRLDGRFTLEEKLKLYEAGHQYAVSGLAKECSDSFITRLSDLRLSDLDDEAILQKTCQVLVIADKHNDTASVQELVDYMVFRRVHLASEAWPAFCHEHPRLANKVLDYARTVPYSETFSLR